MKMNGSQKEGKEEEATKMQGQDRRRQEMQEFCRWQVQVLHLSQKIDLPIAQWVHPN
jgi:hypothetical protein